MAVSINVGDAQPLIRMVADMELDAGTGEAAVSVAEDYSDFVVAPAFGYEIELAVAIEISGGDAVGVRITQHRNRRARRGSEAAVSVTQQDGEGLHAMVGKSQAEDSVSVETADAHSLRHVPARHTTPLA